MKVIGTATRDQLLAMKRAGLSPKHAHDALIAEARRRHPQAEAIVIQKTADGFMILASQES